MATKWVWGVVALASIGCEPKRVEPIHLVSSGRLTVTHSDKMGEAFRLQRVAYTVDGQPVFDSDTEPFEDSLVILNEVFPAGAHNVEVFARYRGNGHGVFEYLKKYKFDVRSKHTVEIRTGEHVQLEVTVLEKCAMPLEERPTITFHKRSIDSKHRQAPGRSPAPNVCVK